MNAAKSEAGRKGGHIDSTIRNDLYSKSRDIMTKTISVAHLSTKKTFSQLIGSRLAIAHLKLTLGSTKQDKENRHTHLEAPPEKRLYEKLI